MTRLYLSFIHGGKDTVMQKNSIIEQLDYGMYIEEANTIH
jgi:hypothetical protein